MGKDLLTEYENNFYCIRFFPLPKKQCDLCVYVCVNPKLTYSASTVCFNIHQVKHLRFGFITYTSTKCLVSPLKGCFPLVIVYFTDWEAIISLMLCSYCSASCASLRVCSSFRDFRMALWSLLGETSSWWFLRALYCLFCTLHVSWNCFLICISNVCNERINFNASYKG